MSGHILAILASLLGAQPQGAQPQTSSGPGSQDSPPHQQPPTMPPAALPGHDSEAASAADGTGIPREIQWQEGLPLPVRVPVSTPDREFAPVGHMTTVAFPETKIDSAISGWNGSERDGLIAKAHRNLLFLKLTRMSAGHLQVIGGSGRHYLLAIEGIGALPAPPKYPADSYVRIVLPKGAELLRGGDEAKAANDPAGSPVIALLRAMRLGLPHRNARILRADGEVALATDQIEIRLRFVYQAGRWTGRIYDVTNLTATPVAIDVTRLRLDGPNDATTLVASALRQNVVPANESTRLYIIFWNSVR